MTGWRRIPTIARAAPEGLEVIRLRAMSLQRGLDARLEAGAIGYDAYLFGRARETNAAARTRLARDVHDRVGNGISLTMRQLEVHQFSPGCACAYESPHRPERPILLAREALAETLLHARDMIAGLRRSEGSGQALEIALIGFRQIVAADGAGGPGTGPGAQSQAAAEVVDELSLALRECLRNAFTHSRAKNVTVDADISDRAVRAEVVDDGIGFDLDTVTRSRSCNGLASVRERTRSVGGTLALTTVPQQGTRVSIAVRLTESNRG